MLLLLAGLALFLFGVRLAGESLQELLGGGMRRLLATATSTSVRAALVGAVITALAQSGTLVTVLTVSFVDAGILTLTRALMVALGAGVGGTVVVQLLSLNLGEFTYPLLAAGLLLGTARVLRGMLGRVAIGLGLLFLGLETMLAGLEPLQGNALFTQVLAALAQQPLVLAVLGAALALLVQSSNAAAALALAFVATGVLSPAQGVAAVIGANVGTTFTAAFVSTAGGVDGRRAAVGHVALKVIGGLIALVLLEPFTRLSGLLGTQPARLIANAHTLFNLLVLLAALPFGSLLARALERLIPTPPDEQGPRYLDAGAHGDPELAYGLAFKEVVRVAEEVQEMYRLSSQALLGRDVGLQIQRHENTVDELVNAVVLYLGALPGAERTRVAALLGVASELEAIADLTKRLARQPRKLQRSGGRFSPQGSEELAELALQLGARMRVVLTALSQRRAPEGEAGVPHGEYSRAIEAQRLRHLDRLAQHPDAARSSSVHLDVLAIFEQMHAGVTRVARLAPQL